MKKLSTKELMQNKAKDLGKHETMTLEKDGKTYFLCGTCLAYEDELCDKIRNAYNSLAEIFGVELDEDYLEDFVSEVRDELLERFESMTNGEIIFGSTEY
jgi:hypothetical protein